jgi:hypothetical protein
MTAETLQDQADEISTLMATKLRVKGASLERQLQKAGRRLPKKRRQDIENLLEAQQLMGNPKLERMVDMTAISEGSGRVIGHLQTLDPWERFKDRWLGILGAIALALIVTFILVVYVLWKRGLV